MKITVVSSPESRSAAVIVASALGRSFSRAQVAIAQDPPIDDISMALVLVHPRQDATWLTRALSGGRKLLLFGRLNADLARALGLRLRQDWTWPAEDGDAKIDPSEPWNESSLAVVYSIDHELGRASPIRRRPLCRFDFGREWNNLGFGRIGLDGGDWSIGPAVELDGATPIAWLESRNSKDRTCCAALLDVSQAAVLWISRPVGPVDSVEWRIIEAFLGDYRPGDLACFPYFSEIPAGFSGAVTMRLDCDEAVASARPLFELYTSLKMPLSLALKTGLEMDRDDRQLLQDVMSTGGAVISHSHRHCPDWGENYQAVLDDALISRRWLEFNLPQAKPIRHAVSPFHRNPPYAVQALANLGFAGFVGGIIDQSPEFLLGRAGAVPGIDPPIVSHSQQCMLHGYCFHRCRNSVEVYVESFENHVRARSIFGYLDHPFSRRYQYGWDSERERLEAHERLLGHCLARPGLWRANLNSCLDFVKKRAEATVHLDRQRKPVVEFAADSLPPLQLQFEGESRAC